MIEKKAIPLISLIWRGLAEGLIWLPIWLILTHSYDQTGKLLVLCAAGLFFGLGLLLFMRLSPLWSRMTLLLLLAGLVGLGIVLFRGEWLILAWLGILLWRGRYPQLKARFYSYAFVLCFVSVILAAQNEAISSFRVLFLALSIWWIVIWFLSTHRGLMDEAGLSHAIVTRPIRLATRRYILIFLTGALLLFALTVNFGEQLLTPPGYVPSEKQWVDVTELTPPAQAQPSLQEMLGVGDQGPPSVFWDILLWVVTGISMLGLLWLLRIMWRDRTWTWRSFIDRIRAWFIREKRIEHLPYIEERRSLASDKRKGSAFWQSLFSKRKQEREWEQLNNPEKVRRLYEKAVAAGIEQGYSFRAYHTSAETLKGIADWRESLAQADKARQTSYWNYVLMFRERLVRLYEKARYSPHSLTDHEVEELKENIIRDK